MWCRCWATLAPTLGQFTDADSPTFLLAELTRDRGVYSLPEAVHRITGKSAQVLGLKERGEIRTGWHADLNVIDYEKLGLLPPGVRQRLPPQRRSAGSEEQGLRRHPGGWASRDSERAVLPATGQAK